MVKHWWEFRGPNVYQYPTRSKVDENLTQKRLSVAWAIPKLNSKLTHGSEYYHVVRPVPKKPEVRVTEKME